MYYCILVYLLPDSKHLYISWHQIHPQQPSYIASLIYAMARKGRRMSKERVYDKCEHLFVSLVLSLLSPCTIQGLC